MSFMWLAAKNGRVLALLTCMVAVAFVGCSSTKIEPPLSSGEKEIAATAAAFRTYALNNPKGVGPKSIEEIKPYMKAFTTVQGGDPEKISVSPNDGQPWAMAWGCTAEGERTSYQGMFEIMGHEQKGANGRIVIVDVQCQPMTIPLSDFPDKLKFVKGYKPPPIN